MTMQDMITQGTTMHKVVMQERLTAIAMVITIMTMKICMEYSCTYSLTV